jgi:hypothetical protein
VKSWPVCNLANKPDNQVVPIFIGLLADFTGFTGFGAQILFIEI